MNNPEVANYITQLKSTDYYARRDAARALAKIADVSAVPSLIKALKQQSFVRLEAAFALGKIGDVSAVIALIEALEDKNELVRRVAAAALQEIGDASTLPYKILAARRLSAEERISLLEIIRRVRYQESGTTLYYDFPDTQTLCRRVLEEGDAEARAGAQEVLHFLDGNILLRASQPDTKTDGQELLRAAPTAPSETQPATLLRASEEPEENAELAGTHSTLCQRLFGKQSDSVS